MSLRAWYDRLLPAVLIDERRANEIVKAAKPHAAALLAPPLSSPEALRVTAVRVEPAESKGGSLIPAWPFREADGAVTLTFVDDWGAIVSAWREAAGDDLDPALDLDALILTGERVWVGIANDVLQMYVPDPPAGTYSMVRHHALMLAAATLWLGPDQAARWQEAHATLGRAFLRRMGSRALWDAISEAEQGLNTLLADPRARASAQDVIGWLDGDRAAADTFRRYVGAASLGIAALLASRPADADPTAWLRDQVQRVHPDPNYNREPIEAFARRVATR